MQYILRNHVDDWCINYARADDSKSCGRLTLLRRRWQKSKKLSCRSRKATNSPDVWVLLSGILMKKAALFTTVLHSGRRTPWASWPPLHGWRWTRPTWRRPARHACVVTESPLLASTITMTRRAPTEYNHRREGVRVDLSVWRSRGRAEGGQDCSVSMASGWWSWIAGAPALAGSAGEGRIGHHGVWQGRRRLQDRSSLASTNTSERFRALIVREENRDGGRKTSERLPIRSWWRKTVPTLDGTVGGGLARVWNNYSIPRVEISPGQFIYVIFVLN